MEKDYSDIEILFQQVIANIKGSYPLWEELCSRAYKLHGTLRNTITATSAFLEIFQKISDFANGTRGATRDIGTSLTRLCLRHKAIENKMKELTNALMESLVIPLQEQIDDWKKSVIQFDKDHARDYKKAQQNVKKASIDTMRLQKKVNKGKSEARGQLDMAIQEVNNRQSVLETQQKNALRAALVEERKHFCFFISCLHPIMEQEISVLSEVTHLQEIVDNLVCLTSSLPESTEQVIVNAAHGILPFPSTLERKLHRGTFCDSSDVDTLSDKSASSSTSSIQVPSTETNIDAIEERVISSHATNISDIPLPTDRPHTISSSVYQHGHTRPLLAVNTFDPPAESAGTPACCKVADIYARPALVSNKEGRIAAPVPVSAPTVPRSVTSTAGSLQSADTSPHNDKLTSEISSLAEAIRELEVNTAALQMPFCDLEAPSCQSLQCSSGYGTMTNVSSQETIATAADFDALADALLEIDKYCTLPNKWSTNSVRVPPPASVRLLSSSGALSSDICQTDTSSVTGTCGIDDLPPPPSQTVCCDSDDDFPLPPPPDVEALKSVGVEMKSDKLMEGLAAKLAMRHSSQIRPPVAAKSFRHVDRHSMTTVEQKSSECSKDSSSFLSQIQRGVSLRRTVSNDRSAPHIQSKN